MSDTSALTPVLTSQPPRLLDQLRQTALARYGRAEPATRHVAWVLRFILFHGKRHPRELGKLGKGYIQAQKMTTNQRLNMS